MRPPTVHDSGPEVHVQVLPPGDEVTVKLVTADPPLDPGADQETSDEVSDLQVAETDVGCCGTVEGVAVDEATDDAESPLKFDATTVKV